MSQERRPNGGQTSRMRSGDDYDANELIINRWDLLCVIYLHEERACIAFTGAQQKEADAVAA